MFTIRNVIALFLAGAALALCFAAGKADARVMLNGHRVSVRIVGQIDAYPCPTSSCLKAIVRTSWNHLGRDHAVRCAWPRRLHVVSAHLRSDGTRWAHVFACRKTYRWRIA